MEYGSWEQNRHNNLDLLARSEELTDVTIVVDQATFPAHRVVLAAHSDYFYRMFTCGMAETRNEDVKIQGVEPDVFQQVLGYIYKGRVDTTDVEILKGIYLAANMLQMSDLEHLTISKLHKLCNLANCLDMYFFVSTFCDIELHNGIHRKVKRVLSELLSEHWGEMICQTNSATVSSRYTQLFQDGIMPTPAQLNNRPNSGIDKLQQDFLDLDVHSVCEIFRLKSEQEEVSDFSFSFGQTDVCEGLIAWMSHDTDIRKTHIHTLRQYVCLHQVSGSTKKKYCKLMHEITNHDLLSRNMQNTEEGEDALVVTYGQLDQDCMGAWCPVRRIPGLILIHAWNPNDMNTLTSDHVKCHFVRPQLDTIAGEDREEILDPEVLYSIREFGELSEGETHWLTNNNPVLFPNGSSMMLTLDCGVVCGQVYDGMDTNSKCPHHSLRYPDFCMSNIREEIVDLKSATICAAETGHIYVVGKIIKDISQALPPLDDLGNPIPPNETCETFKLVQQPDNSVSIYNSIAACLKGNLYFFGGTTVVDGPRFGYIWCSFDLQEFHTRYTESYKAGHSIWKTKLTSIEEEPHSSSQLHIYDINTNVWMRYPEDTPFRVSGGATVWHLDKLYLIGGYSIEYDCELKSFYQNPIHSVWIFDPANGRWSMGPPLPKSSLVTNDKTISFRGYSFGQATSHAGFIYYSGGATLAINNTFKSSNPGPLNKYEFVSFTKVMKLDPNTETWSQVFMVQPDVKQNYTLYGAVPATINLKRIKVKNGRLVSCIIATEESGELFV